MRGKSVPRALLQRGVDRTRGVGAATVLAALVALVVLLVPTIAAADLTPDSFMSYPDGYQFANYGGVADWALFEDVFGGNVHWWSIADQNYFAGKFTGSYGIGQCYGFAVTAGMFYRGIFGSGPGSFAPGAEVTWDIPRTTAGGGGLSLDEAIERHISKYFFYQFSPDIRETRQGPYAAEDAGVLFDIVEAELEAGWNDPWVLLLWGPGYGHTVNIIDVERTDTGAIFKTYNNNFPDDRAGDPEIVDLVWSPDGFIWGTRDITSIELRRVSVHESDYLEKWWSQWNPVAGYIWVSNPLVPELHVVHTDLWGRRLGRTDAAVFNEIPGAEEVQIAGGLDVGSQAPAEYYLPAGDYTIDLANPKNGRLDYQLFAGDTMLSLTSVGSAPATARVTSLSDQKGFVFQGDGMDLDLGIQVDRIVSTEEERALDIKLGLPTGASFVITPTADARAFSLTARGMSSSSCEIVLTEASSAGDVSHVLSGVELLDGAPLAVEPWDWSRLAEMPIYVRTFMPDGVVRLQAHNATKANLDALLDDMLASGQLPTKGIATSIRKQIAQAPTWALPSHLESLVTEGTISEETADLIGATARAVSPAKTGGSHGAD